MIAFLLWGGVWPPDVAALLPAISRAAQLLLSMCIVRPGAGLNSENGICAGSATALWTVPHPTNRKRDLKHTARQDVWTSNVPHSQIHYVGVSAAGSTAHHTTLKTTLKQSSTCIHTRNLGKAGGSHTGQR
jgi:hypothetical protein